MGDDRRVRSGEGPSDSGSKLELVRTGRSGGGGGSGKSVKGSSWLGNVWLLFFLVVALGSGIGVLFGSKREAPKPEVELAEPSVLRELEDLLLPASSAPSLNAEEADGEVRESLEGWSGQQQWKRWLAAGEVRHRALAVLDALSLGELNRQLLMPFIPRSPFSTQQTANGEVASQRSFARYSWVAELVASLDARAVVDSYTRLRPLLEPAHRSLGYRDGELDQMLLKALARVQAAPVLAKPGRLVPRGAVYVYEDPKLEALSPAEKLLLRMGPRNQKLIQDKAGRIAAEMQAQAHR